MARLPPDWTTHLEGGVSTRVAACTPEGRPEISRGLAVEVLADGRIELLLPRDAGERVLDAIRRTGHVAAVLSLPLTHRTLHIKGRDAEVGDAGPAQAASLERCREAFLAQITPLGFSRGQLMALWYGVDVSELGVVRFAISGAWDQTPGPGAGQAVELQP
jgi:hypothetical protein